MRGPNEGDDDYSRRIKQAQTYADDKVGSSVRSVPVSLIGAFFAGSFPAYLSLLVAGYDGDRLQLPLICAGAFTAAFAYLLIWERDKMRNRACEQYLKETSPHD